MLEVILQRTRSDASIRRVICDLSNTPYVDVAGVQMPAQLHDQLTDVKVDFKIVEAHGPVRDILRSEELEARVGSITRHGTLADLILKTRRLNRTPWNYRRIELSTQGRFDVR